MKYIGYHYSRKFNLGNYETEEIGLKIKLDETDDIDETYRTSKAKFFHLHSIGETLEDTKKALEVLSYNPEKIKWLRTEGKKGVFERYPAPQQTPEQTSDYVNLFKDLQKHDGKLVYGGIFYWTYPDEITIGRKPQQR